MDAQKKRQIIESIVKTQEKIEEARGKVPTVLEAFENTADIPLTTQPPEPPKEKTISAGRLVVDDDMALLDSLYEPVYEPLFEDEEDVFVESEHNGEYEQLIRNSIHLLRIPESTHLVAVAVDKRDELNKQDMVHCIGEPIGGYAYDMTHDSYYIRCVESLDLGSIPVSYKMTTPNSNWVEFVALPDELLERCMTMHQKRLLSKLREKYKDERFAIQFLQSIDC